MVEVLKVIFISQSIINNYQSISLFVVRAYILLFLAKNILMCNHWSTPKKRSPITFFYELGAICDFFSLCKANLEAISGF